MTACADVTSVLACDPVDAAEAAKLEARCLTPPTSASIRSAISLTCAAPLVLVIVARGILVAGLHGADHVGARIGCQSRIAWRVSSNSFLSPRKRSWVIVMAANTCHLPRIHRLGGAVDAGRVLGQGHILHGAMHGDDAGVRFQRRSRSRQGNGRRDPGQVTDRLKLLKGDQAE